MSATEDVASKAALPYHEPAIATILIQASFLILLNALNFILDNLIYCGLLAQVFVGVAWGTPGAKWLDAEAEATITQVGYLGLILIVYEGGLSTSFASLRANLVLSVAVALTGIAVPMGLSFVLGALMSATPLQSFAAGAALCATSLGTTFSILGTSGLTATRLGTVLTSAAMLDDVVGLILVQVISNLGGSDSSFTSLTVVRPVAVSFGLVIVLLLFCRYVVSPGTGLIQRNREKVVKLPLLGSMNPKHVALGVHTAILVGFVAGATYAGTSGLFAVYLAGASIRWWDDSFLETTDGGSNSDTQENRNDSCNEAIRDTSPAENAGEDNTSNSNTTSPQSETAQQEPREPAVPKTTTSEEDAVHPTGTFIYDKYYFTAVSRILKPFFFASIGFAIPITKMFQADIIWRGIIYTILMLLGKLVTGLWLVRFDIRLPRPSSLSMIPSCFGSCFSFCSPWSWVRRRRPTQEKNATQTTQGQDQEPKSTASNPGTSSPNSLLKPRSLYPASILGSAMVARGEIGFLISSLAESKGIFAQSPYSQSSSSSSRIFLVVTWAIMLCTVIGPIVVGALVRRVKRLQVRRGAEGGPDPLGVWGV